MSTARMSGKTADILFGRPADELDSPLFHHKLLLADASTPSLACLNGIRDLHTEVEAQFALADLVIAESVQVVAALLADIADPALFVLEPE